MKRQWLRMCSDNFFQWKLRTKNKSKIDVAIAEVNVHVETSVLTYSISISRMWLPRLLRPFRSLDLFWQSQQQRSMESKLDLITSPTSRVVEYCLSSGESTYVRAKQLLANRLYGETTTIPFLLLRLVLARSLIYLNFLTIFSFLHSPTCFLFLLKGRLWFNFHHAT